MVFYRVEVRTFVLERVMTLTDEGRGKAPMVPEWYDLGIDLVAERRAIATADPEWFERLEEAIRA